MLAETFPDMLHRAAARWPERTFLRWSDRDRSLTFAEVDDLSDRAADALATLDVGRGDRVGLLAHNGLDYLVAMFGTWKAGAITAHISVQVAADLAQYAADCTPSVLIYTHDLYDAVDRDRDQMTSVRHYICMDGAQPGAVGWADLLASARPGPTPPTDPDAPCHLSYTSGSTGRPKGAVLKFGPTARATACIAERLGLSGDDASLGATSPASSYGLVANWLPGLHVGMTVGLRSRWDVAAVFDDLEANHVTYVPGNPILLADLLAESRRRGGPPSRLRLVVSGGAAVPPELKRAYFDELSVPFCESYGQSELGGFVALGRPTREADDLLGAVGQPLPDKVVSAQDDAGAEVAPGEPGELCIRGGFMWGYWGLPDRTAEVLRDGWLRTGDVGTMDADGYVTTLGRVSERITQGGEVLYPRPIEELLLADDRVALAAVIGVPDAALGQVPVAVVTLGTEDVVDADVVLAAYLARGGDPRLRRVEVVDVMPMTATGKMDKISLRKRFGA
ncbi:MAG TPA: class I adenylate-forming enzyme family protein [Acidimicrobiales bacterium]|nr:class I adenylate-forming enzyme family protein [Acidimicrobiales bacterium]